MIEETDYHGWKALSLKTDAVELVVPRDIGPRVISCSLQGGANLFRNVPEELGGTGESEWCLRGGHRLWHSPEKAPRTYELDNGPIELEAKGAALKAIRGTDPISGISLSIAIEALSATSFKLTHRLVNSGNAWPIELAPWSLTVMAPGGYEVLPLPPKGSHETDLLPSYSIIPWTYTDLGHPIWQIEREFIGVDQTKADCPQKLGITSYPGWSAYWQEAGTFVKYSAPITGGNYPDFGCCFETFTKDDMLELETLGELIDLEPEASVEHVEYWGLFADLPRPDSAETFANSLKPAVQAWLEGLPS